MCIIVFPQTVKKAIRRLEQAGFQAYAVGGCVRDSLLGKCPLDWDLTTSAPPEQIKSCFAGCRTVDTGIRHGTVAVELDGAMMEITTFRADGGYRDHRHPDTVVFGKCLTDDLSRRDFTINAMACRPGEPVIDLYGGKRDLEKKQICCVGNPARRFEEDALRIMRALRFASVLGFSLEKKTAEALQAHAPLLRYIAVERLVKEFNSLLVGDFLAPVLMEYGGVLAEFLPELQPILSTGEWNRAIECAGRIKGDHIQKLAALFAWKGSPFCCNLLQRLRYDRKTIRTVCTLAKEWKTPPQEKKEMLHLLCRAGEKNARRLTGLWAACCPNHPSVAGINKKLEQLLLEGGCYSLQQLKICGKELSALGIPPGPKMGHVLENLLEQVMDGVLPNRKEVLLQAAAKLADLSS